jgi:hypothetical protein
MFKPSRAIRQFSKPSRTEHVTPSSTALSRAEKKRRLVTTLNHAPCPSALREITRPRVSRTYRINKLTLLRSQLCELAPELREQAYTTGFLRVRNRLLNLL